jgi:hypothetical protein
MERLKSPIEISNGNVYNSEDMMSIPTSITRNLFACEEELELALAA